MIEGRTERHRRRACSRIPPMHRAWAWMLVVLVASPFTSPFSTCDVHALVKAGVDVSRHHIVPLSTGAILVTATDTDSPPVSLDEETFKDDVVLAGVNLVIDMRAERPAFTPVQAPSSVLRSSLVALRL
jgi:hypothetical protein